MLPSPFKHKQVEAGIRQLTQTLPIGARLPAERKLAISHGCNFLTVRRALKELVNEGLVVRRVGSGTFVSAHKISKPIAVNRIGVLVCQGSEAHSYRLLQSLANAALQHQVELRLRWVSNLQDDCLFLKQEGCAVITLPWIPHERAHEVRALAHSCPLPISLPPTAVGSGETSLEHPEFFGETLQPSLKTSCQYFHKLGHRRIALLGPDSPTNTGFEKALSTYARYMARENLPNICGLVSSGAPAIDRLAEQWSAYRGDLAIISYDDEHALRLMTAMHKIGLSAPNDFTIVGCNDTEASKYSDPPLSTLRQNFEYAGYWLIKNALALASGATGQPMQLPRPQMMVRSTCGGIVKINDAFRAQLPALDIVTDAENAPTPALQKTH